jgi:hypothetical protein
LNTTQSHSFNASLSQSTSLMPPSQACASPGQLPTPLGLRQPVQSLQSPSSFTISSPGQPNAASALNTPQISANITTNVNATASTLGHPLGSPLFTPPSQHARLPSEATSVVSTAGGGNGPDCSSATSMGPTITNSSIPTENSPATAVPFNIAALMSQPTASMLPAQLQQQLAQQLSNLNRIPERMIQFASQMAGFGDRPLASLNADEKVMLSLNRALADINTNNEYNRTK